MTQPLVSVIIAVKNETTLLKEALADICAQSLRETEILLVNDDSEPEATNIIQKLAETDTRIRLLDSPGLGQGGAINRALPHARGQFIANADADDRYEPDRLEKQVAFLRKNPEIGLCGCLFDTIPAGRHWELPLKHADIHAQMVINSPMIHSAFMYRASVLKDHPYPEEFMQAPDYAMLASLRNRISLANLPDQLVTYRMPRVSPEKLLIRRQEADKIRNSILREDYGITDPDFLQIHESICQLEAGINSDRLTDWFQTLLSAGKGHPSALEKALHAQAFRYAKRHLPGNRKLASMHLLKSGFPAGRMAREMLRLLR